MRKTAVIGDLVHAFRVGASALSEGERLFLGSLLLGSAAIGGTAGYLTAKASAHNNNDYEVAKKEYSNEQTKADIGYMYNRLAQERKALADSKPKAMRMF